jgi:hypothetical protein
MLSMQLMQRMQRMLRIQRMLRMLRMQRMQRMQRMRNVSTLLMIVRLEDIESYESSYCEIRRHCSRQSSCVARLIIVKLCLIIVKLPVVPSSLILFVIMELNPERTLNAEAGRPHSSNSDVLGQVVQRLFGLWAGAL